MTGNHLALPLEFSFTTRDTTPPVLLGTVPADGAANQTLLTTLAMAFSKPMATAGVLLDILPAVPGIAHRSWNASGTILTVWFAEPFAAGTRYQVTIDPAGSESFGIPISGSRAFSFTTGAIANPRVVSVVPLDGAVVSTSTPKLWLTFDHPMDPVSVAAALSFTPADGVVLN